MVLQAFSDVTFIDENGTRLFGPGEILTLPMPDALKAMNLAHEHFKILALLLGEWVNEACEMTSSGG